MRDSSTFKSVWGARLGGTRRISTHHRLIGYCTLIPRRCTRLLIFHSAPDHSGCPSGRKPCWCFTPEVCVVREHMHAGIRATSALVVSRQQISFQLLLSLSCSGLA